MKISKKVLSNIFEAAGDFDNANGYADSARKALEAGTLEIEGYERVQWTKFDQNDPETLPPDGEEVLVYYYDGVAHWRPLQKPPTETEEGK